MSKNYDQLAAVEKAIAEKYGEETIQNPKANWDENKEKEYLEQMKALYQKYNVSTRDDRESIQSCPVCGEFPKKSMDNVCLVKFECCEKCYYKYVQQREDRWLKGWRPNEDN